MSNSRNKQLIPNPTNGCDYLSMLGLKLNHVSKWGPCTTHGVIDAEINWFIFHQASCGNKVIWLVKLDLLPPFMCQQQTIAWPSWCHLGKHYLRTNVTWSCASFCAIHFKEIALEAHMKHTLQCFWNLKIRIPPETQWLKKGMILCVNTYIFLVFFIYNTVLSSMINWNIYCNIFSLYLKDFSHNRFFVASRKAKKLQTLLI